ncbi:MAG: hypothetical protein ABIT76_08610 [Chthoniobacterales bacterium]
MDADAQLLEMSAELAALESAPWEPVCVSEAFARRGPDALVFTMQGWIDLEKMKSPLLRGELPDDDEEAAFAAAIAAFEVDLVSDATDLAAAVVIMEGMIAEINAAFAMSLRVRQADAGIEIEAPEPGIGHWLAIYAALVSQLGLTPAEAKRSPVCEAFALLAGHRVNQRWTIVGPSYRDREIPDLQTS